MRTAFGLLEIIIVTVIIMILFLLIPKNIKQDMLPTKESVQNINTQKDMVNSKIKEIEQLKIEHDKEMQNFE